MGQCTYFNYDICVIADQDIKYTLEEYGNIIMINEEITGTSVSSECVNITNQMF